MDDRDLTLLRGFRADEGVEPPGLAARCTEDLWQAILAEEAGGSRASRARSARQGRILDRWRGGLLRPAAAFGAAAMLAGVVAVASDGGTGSVDAPGAAVRQAGTGVLDSTVRSIFGADAVTAAVPVGGSIDIREQGEERAALAGGPSLGDGGELDDASAAAAASAPRDPVSLLATLRAAAAEATDGGDAGDRVAFALAMEWASDPAVPNDLRASMLRSVDRMSGLDGAAPGADVLGRNGIVVSHLDRATGIREQFVLDPDGGELREHRAFTAAYMNPACPPVTFTAHAAYGDDGELIDPASLPYLDWPQVVEVCDPARTD